MPAFLVLLSTAGLARLQDGPGCASPADGDPCRTRTCVHCLRGSRPTARRTGREGGRKVEVSNPHGRTVSLFSKQGAPSQRGIPSRAEGQRIERWRGRPRPSLSKRAPFLSVNPPTAAKSAGPSADSAPGSIRTSILRLRRPLRVQSRHGGNEDRDELRSESHHPEPTRGPQPYQGCALPTELWRRGLADWTRTSGLCLRRAALCPTELRRDGTPARTRTRNWRFVVSCDHPFHHQGLAPQAGFDPAASAVTRRRSPD